MRGATQTVTFTDALKQDLEVMDATAFALCRDNEMRIIVFNMTNRGNIERVVCGDPVGTTVVRTPTRLVSPETIRGRHDRRHHHRHRRRHEEGGRLVQARPPKIRTGRANTSMLDGIKVDYYGTPTPVNQVATVQVVDARLITVKPWEKNMIAVIDKAIRASDLGINPVADGELVRLPIPPLTQERRERSREDRRQADRRSARGRALGAPRRDGHDQGRREGQADHRGSSARRARRRSRT